DPEGLSAWYRDCLGLDVDEHGLWRQESGPTVFATFEPETDYFGSRTQQTSPTRRRTWRASAGSAGSPIPRVTGSSCGSPPDRGRDGDGWWHAGGVILACHTLIYSDDAAATRAFFRDVLGFANVDAGT